MSQTIEFFLTKVWIFIGCFLDIFWIVVTFLKENGEYNITEKPKKVNKIYHFGEFRIDSAERRLWCKSEPISLTPKQFDLLFYFVENAGRTAKKSELLDAVWADIYIEETTLARNVSWLRQKLVEYSNGESFIETVPKLGYRFTAEVTQPVENLLIIDEETFQYTRGEETITFDDEATEAVFRKESEPKTISVSTGINKFRQSFTTPIFVILALAVGILAGVVFVNFNNQSKADDLSRTANKPIIAVTEANAAPLKIGSIVHLKSAVSDNAGYLDVWGEVKDKPVFKYSVNTEVKFVSTHSNPNRENNSGSWRIISASGKKEGETLVYGDKIHLQSMFTNGGFLDSCGWLVDMGDIFKDFINYEKLAVFTTDTPNRDRGSGTWTIGSNSEYKGKHVLEGHNITLENGFAGGGYLNAQGFLMDVSEYAEHDGIHLVFVRASTPNPRPPAGIWTISTSNVIFE